MLGLGILKGKCFERPGRSPSWPKAKVSIKADGLQPSGIELSLEGTANLWMSRDSPLPSEIPSPGGAEGWQGVGGDHRSSSLLSQKDLDASHRHYLLQQDQEGKKY